MERTGECKATELLKLLEEKSTDLPNHIVINNPSALFLLQGNGIEAVETAEEEDKVIKLLLESKGDKDEFELPISAIGESVFFFFDEKSAVEKYDLLQEMYEAVKH